MSVERFQILQNGQEVQQADINLLGDAGGLADDHVLAELLRLAPFNGGGVAKAVLPFGTAGTVVPAGATGAVNVNPFRAIVGSRDTAANIGPLGNWNDLRSAIFTGPNALSVAVPLQANTTTTARWDLLYAQMGVDQPGAQVSRYRKDPATEQVTVVQVSRSLVQGLAVGVLTGAASGAKPQLPPDGGGTYFFPLAYVRIGPNFGPLSTVASTDIEEQLPYQPASPTTGAATLMPANHQFTEGGTVLSAANFGWSSAPGRPTLFMPPSMSGCEGRLVAIDMIDPASANWSHQSGAVVDTSRDWRNRIWRWWAMFTSNKVNLFPWNPFTLPSVVSTANVPKSIVQANGGVMPANGMAIGMGQSFMADSAMLTPAPATEVPVIAQLSPQNAGLAANVYIALVVDHGSGALKVLAAGAPGLRVFFWVEATAQYPNF